MPEDDPDRADAVMADGWKIGSHPAVALRPPLDWDRVCAANRSWHYHLHCWHGLGPVLAAHSVTGEARYLDFAVELALDWVTRYPKQKTTSPFAWYDMAVGLRAYRLGYIVERMAESARPRSVLQPLLKSAALHLKALADDRSFASHSNHGFYQAAGQLVLASRAPQLRGAATARRQATVRIRQLISSQFTEEGVHTEHSPGYHLLVLEALDRLLSTGLVDDPALVDVRARAAAALPWFVMPNGRFAMLGDTSHSFTPRLEHRDCPELRFVITRGRAGAAPKETWCAFPASGYFVARDRWPEGPDDFDDCSYLAQTACFHSTAHKHADDCSFVWYDRGREILADAGRFGYLGKTQQGSELWRQGFNYSDPRRVYVESTSAHNAVEVDGRSHPRRDVEPFGSALLDAGEHDGVAYSECLVVYPSGVHHRRILALRPGVWLLVMDWLADERGATHDYSQRFLFAPEVAACRTQRGVRLNLAGERLLHMAVPDGAVVEGPVRGQREPRLLGWISRSPRQLIPAFTAAVTARATPVASLTTVFAFAHEEPRLAVEGPPSPREAALHQLPGRLARLRWTADRVRWDVAIDRLGSGKLTVAARHGPPDG